MISVFADQNIGQQTGARPPAFNRARGQWRLDNRLAARTGFAQADNPLHLEATQHVFQFLGPILAQGAQRATTLAAIIAG